MVPRDRLVELFLFEPAEGVTVPGLVTGGFWVTQGQGGWGGQLTEQTRVQGLKIVPIQGQSGQLGHLLESVLAQSGNQVEAEV